MIAFASSLYVLSVAAFGEAPTWRTTNEACEQPRTIVYESGSTFRVYVQEPSLSLSLRNPAAVAIVGRNSDYGDHITLHVAVEAGDVTCRWTEQGVAIREPNGVVHSVPAAVFTAGR